jgi:ABC-type multidrug transport system ATPase subunit
MIAFFLANSLVRRISVLCCCLFIVSPPTFDVMTCLRCQPSTGMDPASRRFMWRLIQQTMQGRSVILTTHSMEEAEALCGRIGILVNGQLQCLGNAQHLKHRFGSGYQLDFHVVPDIQRFSSDRQASHLSEGLILREELQQHEGLTVARLV